jgi:ketosteroid isomerase-like protein
MHPNQQLIQQLYESFARKDHQGMAACYHPEATFADEAFDLKTGKEIAAMWHMLLASGKDMRMEFRDVAADDHTGKAHWEAHYTFSKTGRKVHNIIDAEFAFKDGKIFRHRDHFNFWRWAGMALGTSGKLLGWTSFLQKKVRQTAMGNLQKFVASHPEYAG